jgi:23S rRNA pseudouridine1911/1915/1917 synthase
MQKFLVKPADTGVRADIFVAAQYPKFSRSALEMLFENGSISLEGKLLKPAHKLQPGQTLSIDETLLDYNPEPIELEVIYEDDNVVVINKPAGILTHSKGVLNPESTVASFVGPKLDKQLAGNRAGIVHRLDRGTSGVIITARNSMAQTWLQKQFAGRRTKKTYLAVVEGTLELEEAVIDAPIARNPKKPQTFYVNNSGKPSQTQYKVLKSFIKDKKAYSLIELKPHTGRTHQIRVHMAYIGHPIVGDHLYGLSGPNLLLHAQSLELTLPGGVRKVFSTPVPAYLTDFTKV